MRNNGVWNWFKRKQDENSPTFRQMTTGELHVESGTILLADPMCMDDPVRIQGVPPGRWPFWGLIVRYPEGGERLAKIGLQLRPGIAQERRPLGNIPVDSAVVVAVDEQTYQTGWREVGPARVGCLCSPAHNEQVARLIGRKFGLKSHGVNGVRSEFDEPISEEMEERIIAYLQTFPFYAEHTFLYFHVETNNTFYLVQESINDRLWGEVVLDTDSGFNLLAFSSGFGDGSYSVEGLYNSEELRRVEIAFIDAAQDKVLEAFPLLRY
jgi:hypothetical protein